MAILSSSYLTTSNKKKNDGHHSLGERGKQLVVDSDIGERGKQLVVDSDIGWLDGAIWQLGLL